MDSQFNRFNSLKILAHSDRLRQVADGGMPYPVDWHIYPSNICNHTCSWCMFRQNGEQFNFRVQLPREILFRAVDDAARTEAVLTHFSGGGEPLINKHTVPAMERAVENGLSVALSTNGAFLTPEVVRTVDFVRVSLNAGTKEQHDMTNHPEDTHTDWYKILENIEKSAPHKKRDLGLAFVVDHHNYRDILPFCKIASEVGADFVHIRPAFWYDKKDDIATRTIMPLAFELSEEAKALYGDKVKIFAISEKFDGYWTDRTYDRCLAVLTGTCLTATGEFAVCQDRTDLRFGASYTTGTPFEDIWGSEEHRKLVSTIVAGEQLDACPRCVWNKRNEIIKYVFQEDEMRLDLV